MGKQHAEYGNGAHSVQAEDVLTRFTGIEWRSFIGRFHV
jgi:hypothetical protein